MQEQNLPTPVGAENLPKPLEVDKPNGGEVSSDKSPENVPRGEATKNTGDRSIQAAPSVPASDLPQPISAPTDHRQQASAVQGPSVADDVDVIEKVWVEKAKSIVKETRDDPHEQERQVSDLQSDYQKKRFGKDAEQQG